MSLDLFIKDKLSLDKLIKYMFQLMLFGVFGFFYLGLMGAYNIIVYAKETSIIFAVMALIIGETIYIRNVKGEKKQKFSQYMEAKIISLFIGLLIIVNFFNFYCIIMNAAIFMPLFLTDIYVN